MERILLTTLFRYPCAMRGSPLSSPRSATAHARPSSPLPPPGTGATPSSSSASASSTGPGASTPTATPAPPTTPSSASSPAPPRFLDTLVVGYAVAGKPELALHLLGRMRFRGLDLDAFSFHVLLNALVDASLFDFADSLSSHIASRGLAGPVTSCICLKALCRQGRFADAELLLRQREKMKNGEGEGDSAPT